MSDPSLVVRVAANLSEMKSNLAEGVNQVETYTAALRSASSAYDGSRIIAQAGATAAAIQNAGGVTALTAAEQVKANAILDEAIAKYEILGRTAPSAMVQLRDSLREANDSGGSMVDWMGRMNRLLVPLGIGLSAFTAINFAKSIVDDASALVNLHDKTGITLEGLQAMKLVGDQSGVSIDALALAVDRLQKQLGSGNEGAISAIGDLGINLKSFIALDGYGQMTALSGAVQGLHDPLRTAADLSAIFGKSWADILPVLKKGFKEVQDDAAIMSDSTVQSAKNFDDEWTLVLAKFKAGIADAVSEKYMGPLAKEAADMASFAKEVSDAAKDADWGALVPPGVPKDLDDIMLGFQKDAEAIRQHAEEVKKQIQAWTELNTLGASVRETYEGIDPPLRGLIDDYIAAGASVDKLANAFPELSKAQIQAVKEIHDKNVAALTEVMDLWAQYDDLVGNDGASAFDKQINAIDRWAEQLEAKAQAAGTDTAEFYEALTALWNLKLKQASDNNDAAMKNFGDHAVDAGEEATSAFDDWNQSIMNVNKSLDGTIIDTDKLAEAQQQLRDAGNTQDIATVAEDPEINALLHFGWSLKNAMAIHMGHLYNYIPKLYDNYGNPESQPSPDERVPGYAAGVLGAPGGLAMVGELGPELVQLPRGANVYPTGMTPAAPISLTVSVGPFNYPIMNDPGARDQLAQLIGEAFMTRLRQIGLRLPTGA